MIQLIAAFLAGAGGGVPIYVSPTTWSSIGTASLTMQSDGDLVVVANLGGSPYAREWFAGNPSTGVGSNWEVYATLVSGTLSTGTTGSWLSLASGQSWSKDPTGTAQLTFAFRPAGGTTAIYTSGTVTLDAQSI